MTEPIPLWTGRQGSLGDREVFVRYAAVDRAAGADAEPALYVHGLGGSAANWTDLMALLSGHPAAAVPGDGAASAAAAAADPVLLDGAAVALPGFGFSPPPPDRDYSINGFAKTLARLIPPPGRRPGHPLRHPLSGAVCTRRAPRRPPPIP